MDDRESRDLVERGTGIVYRKTSRRGFLAKMSSALAGLGVGQVVLAQTASADPKCCTGTACRSIGVTCNCDGGGRQLCPEGWSYNGYTWGCCLEGDRLFLCRDCVSDTSGTLCVCGCRTTRSCAPTLTELAAEGV